MARSLLSAVISIAGGKVGVLLISVVFTPILVRLLGPTDYGRYAVILSIFAFANIIMTSGTNDTVRKFISERTDTEWREAVFGTTARLAVLLSLGVAVAFLISVASGLVSRTLGADYVPLITILALYSLGRQCRDYFSRTLMGLQLEEYSEPLKVIQRALFATLALAAVYLGYNVAGVLVADIITSFTVGLVALLVLTRFIDVRALISPPDVDLPRCEMYRYLSGTIVFFGCLTSLYHVDVLFLQYWATEQIVGYYKGALTIAEVLWIVPATIQLALLQRVSTLWDDGDLETIQQQAARVTRFAVLFTLLIVLGMGALATDFVALYLGPEFTPTVTPLLLLLPGIVGFAAARPTLAINQARRSLRPLILATAGCAVLNLLLNTLLVPLYGMIGAAIATSTAYGSLVLFQTAAARASGYAPFQDFPFGRTLLTVLLAAIPIVGVARLIEPAILSLILVPPIGFVAFWAIALTTGAMDWSEIAPLIGRLRAVIEQ